MLIRQGTNLKDPFYRIWGKKPVCQCNNTSLNKKILKPFEDPYLNFGFEEFWANLKHSKVRFLSIMNCKLLKWKIDPQNCRNFFQRNTYIDLMTDSTIKVDNTRLFPSTNGPSAYKNGKYLSTYCKVEWCRYILGQKMIIRIWAPGGKILQSSYTDFFLFSAKRRLIDSIQHKKRLLIQTLIKVKKIQLSLHSILSKYIHTTNITFRWESWEWHCK